MVEKSNNYESFKAQKFEPYDGFPNVYKSDKLEVVDEKQVKFNVDINNYSDSEPLVVSKYMKLSYLINSIKGEYFFFASPDSWLDPFETLFYKPVMKIGENEEVSVHACCFTCNDIENEEGFWNIWSKGEKEPIVRVTYNMKRLVENLSRANFNQYDFYLGGMTYTSREQILTKAVIQHKYNNISEYINNLCLKRNAYKYENELRLYVKRNKRNEKYTKLEEFSYSGNIITEITLPPIEPLGNSHPAKDMVKCIQDCKNLEIKEHISSVLQEKEVNCKITQSALYCTGIRDRSY